MDIGIIRPYEVEFNQPDIEDLEQAVREFGHRVKRVYVNMASVRLSKGSVSVYQAIGRGVREPVSIDGGVLRHLGLIRDFEQLLHRVWVVRAIESMGVYVVNSAMNWLVASDKLAALMILAKNGLPVPETESSENMFMAYDAVKRFNEAVVKELRGSMGYGVFKVNDPDVAMNIFSYLLNFSKPMYVQKFLEKKGNGDYRVVVVGGQVIGSIFRRGIGWKSNVAQGAKPEAVKPSSELSELAVKTCEVLGLGYAGVDVAETNEGYFILEVNPSMSWQGFKETTGINPARHIIKHVIDNVKK
ncbi:ATP-grasp domain-containing protein [Caldivirga sp.]|uniref:ATP-grasp domain-containing protein n=1 Tax=Caldivirga sp. TaxID=2080243 RepID=UPI003D0F9A09